MVGASWHRTNSTRKAILLRRKRGKKLPEALEDQLATGLVALAEDPARVKSIVAWNWIINALLE